MLICRILSSEVGGQHRERSRTSGDDAWNPYTCVATQALVRHACLSDAVLVFLTPVDDDRLLLGGNCSGFAYSFDLLPLNL